MSRLRPDVTLMDIRMPVLDGLAATRRIVEAGVPTRIVVLTTFDLDEYVFAALRAGASGFLLKDAPAEELAAAHPDRCGRRRAAGAGGDPAGDRRLRGATGRRRAGAGPAAGPLTPREFEVLGLLARGLTNVDIATRLFVSEGTTKTHVSNVLAKLGLRDRVQAVIFAYENGVVVTPARSVARLSRRSAVRQIRLSPPARQSSPCRHPGRTEENPMTTFPTETVFAATTLVSRETAAARRSRSDLVRRAALIAVPVLAGGFLVLGAAGDPAAGFSGADMTRLYIENPGPLQWKSTGYHWAYALWMLPALLTLPYTRRKGAWLGNLAALIGFAGLVSLPGMLLIDWIDSAVGQLHGEAAVGQLHSYMEATMWGLPGFMIPGFLGLALALPLTAAALWQSGRGSWWGLLAAVAAFAVFLLGNATVLGNLGVLACLAVFSLSLVRVTRPAQPIG